MASTAPEGFVADNPEGFIPDQPDVPRDFQQDAPQPETASLRPVFGNFPQSTTPETPPAFSRSTQDIWRGLSPSQQMAYNQSLMEVLQKPVIQIPRIETPPNANPLIQAGAAAINVASGLVSGATAPMMLPVAAGSLLGPEVPLGVMAGLAAKTAGESFGELSVEDPNRSVQQTTEDILNPLSFAVLMKSSNALKQGDINAALERSVSKGGEPQYRRIGSQVQNIGSDRVFPPEVIKTGDEAGSGNSLPERTPTPVTETIPVEAPSPGGKVENFISRYFTKERGLPEEAYALTRERAGDLNEQAVKVEYAVSDLKNALRDIYPDKVDPDTVSNINEVIAGRETPNILPESLREPVAAMRDHVDALSQRLLDTGMLSDQTSMTVAENLGSYLTRSYRVFEDPKWVYDTVPQDIVNQSKRIVSSELDLSDAQAESHLRDLFSDWKSGGVGEIFNPRRLGSKDISVLMQRKDIDPTLRALMGEYKDPFINYQRSISKLSRLVADQEFLSKVRDVGIGKWLFEDGKNPVGFNSLIAQDESSVMSPLNGLRTSEHIANIFNEWGRVNRIENPALKAYMFVNGVSKMAKTVYSAMTHARNALGQGFFWMLNGHYKPDVISALRVVGSEFSKSGDEGLRQYHAKMARLGLTDESAFGGELRDSIADFSKALSSNEVSPLDVSLAKKLKMVAVDFPEKVYRVTDELGKVAGFEAELGRIKRDFPEAGLPQQEKMAAERIRNTYPTYSNIAGWAKMFRRIPLVGPFMSFPYEIFRTVGHSMDYLQQDIRAGRVRSSIERGSGMLAALAGLNYGVQALSRSMQGIGKNDERDLRRQLPDWEKDSTLLYTGHGKGTISYINMSYANPYSYLTDPIIAAINAHRNEGDAFQDTLSAAASFLSPFSNEQMLAGALMDIRSNQDQYGRRVFNPQDTPGRIFEDKMAHIWTQALEPGSLSRLRTRIIPAAEGRKDAKATLSEELIAEGTGFRNQSHDFVDTLRFRGRKFEEDLKDAGSLFTQGIKSDKPSDDILGQYQRSEDARFKLYTELHRDIQVARRQGATDDEIRVALVKSGVGKGTVNALMQARYEPSHPSSELVRDAKTFGKTVPIEEINRIRGERFKLVLPP